MNTWNWVLQHAVAMFLALLLGTLLGSLPLFKESALGDTHMNASHLVKFIGYGGALLLFWFAGRRATLQLQEEGKGVSALRHLIMPLVTLIGLSGGYEVLLQLAGPLLGKTGKSFYNWFFVIGIVSTALWLTVAWLRHSEPLLETFRTIGTVEPLSQPSRSVACPQCGSLTSAGANFCAACGERVGKQSVT